MKKLVFGICAMAIVASMGIASAAPAMKTQTPVAASNVIQAQVGVREDGRLDYRSWDREPGDPVRSRDFIRPDRDYNNYRPGRDRDYRDYRDYRPRYDRGYVRNWDRPSYYRGYRGYRDYRPGYRRHDGFWYPAGAFIAGAIIGGALSQPTVRARGYGNSHVEWCYDRYRSYRASDNTFQPYNGPRRQCRSPYY